MRQRQPGCAGAGPGYPVVDVLHPGERVEVDYCKGAWCAVEKRGPDGWVNANYLDSGRDYDDEDGYYYDDRDEPDFFIPTPRSRVLTGSLPWSCPRAARCSRRSRA